MTLYFKQHGLYLYQRWLLPLVKSIAARILSLSKGSLSKGPLSKRTLARLAQRLTIEKQYRVEIGHPLRVVIFLVGCGGTGSFAAHILAQLVAWAQSVGLDLRLYFVDPDHVEEKNLVRQNFCPAEIGQAKAFTLAWRYTAAFGVRITPLVERFSVQLLERCRPGYSTQGTLTIIAGAVDNVCARRDIAAAVEAWLKNPNRVHDKIWWIDSGNERMNGQVLAGNSLEVEPALSPLGFCVGLPLPHLQEPTLLLDRVLRQAQDDPLRQTRDTDLSCAELTLLGEQSAMINRVMAAWLGVYLYRLLQSRDLKMMATFINLTDGAVRSKLITTGRVARPSLPQPVQLRPAAQALVTQEAFRCPACGGEAIIGQDEQEGVLIGVRFCVRCDWREQGCPECFEAVEEDELEIEGRYQLALVCTGCNWFAALPDPAVRREAGVP